MIRAAAAVVACMGLAVGCQCVRVPDGPYACNTDTGEDCDGGPITVDAGRDGGTVVLPFPADLCPGHWCWDNPRPVGRVQLRSVLALAADDVWAAGSAGNLIHWNGTRWQQVPTESSAGLYRIWAADRRAVWVVGNAGTVLEWNGERLVRHDAGSGADLRGVSGRSPREIHAVGANGAVVRYEGQQWSRSLVPTATGGLYAVQVWPDGGVLAMGDYGLQLESQQWSLVPRPDAGAVSTLWAPARNDVWACGAAGGLYRNTTGDFTSPANWVALDAGTAAAVGAVFTLGSHLFWGATTGGLWESTSPVQVSSRSVSAIHALQENDVWAVGNGTILHRVVPGSVPEDLSPHDAVTVGLEAVAVVPGGAAWAVGDNHTVLVRDGGAWGRVRTEGEPLTGWFYDVWTAPDAPVIAVGNWPLRMAYWDAGSRQMSEVRVPLLAQDLWGIWGSSANDIWAVGQAGTVLHFDGNAWSLMPAPSFCAGANLEEAWGTGPNDVWIAGDLGCVAHWTGTSFTDESLGMFEPLLTIAGLPSGDVWVGSQYGKIFRRTGSRAWTQETAPIQKVNDMTAHDGTVYAVGDLGVILQRDASGVWARMAPPVETNTAMEGIRGAPGEGLIAVGSEGTILYRK